MTTIGQAAKWRARTTRQKWYIILTIAIAACAQAIAVPSMRAGLLLFAGGSLLIGWVETESRRSRREREALVARLAELPPADVPADVVTLV
jgi:uncharacterized membrane protein